MTTLPSKAFNPKTTTVPILGPSSGNPSSLQDPKSVASIGSNIQAMTDQANADQLYDTQIDSFVDLNVGSIHLDYLTAGLILVGILCILRSF